jgi:hypothetical protein
MRFLRSSLLLKFTVCRYGEYFLKLCFHNVYTSKFQCQHTFVYLVITIFFFLMNAPQIEKHSFYSMGCWYYHISE